MSEPTTYKSIPEAIRAGAFQGANLTGAYLTGADLRRADLTGANLAGVDLAGAVADQYTVWPDGFTPVDHGVVVR